MADITYCMNGRCPHREVCARGAEPPVRGRSSFAFFDPEKEDCFVEVKVFAPNRPEPRERKP